MPTPFQNIYEMFFDKITDDLYLELTEIDTKEDCHRMLVNAIPKFEFPKQSLSYVVSFTPGYDDVDNSYFNNTLTMDEKNILATLMVLEWLQRQINSIENTAQKFYGNGFKLTSQAAHLNKLLALKESVKQDAKYLQRLYKRRNIKADGQIASSWSMFNTYN